MDNIPDISFRKKEKKKLEFEIFPIQNLFKRKGKFNHSIHAPHRIGFYLIQYISKGSGNHYIDFKPYPYDQGSLIFISKGQVHAFDIQEDTEGFIILFTEPFISKNLIHSDLLSLYRLYNYHLHIPVIPGNEIGKDAGQIIENMFDEYQHADDFAKEEILRLLVKLLLLKAERVKRTLIDEEKNANWLEKFAHFQTQVEKRFAETRNAKDYALDMSISYKHLNEVTKAVTGSTAKEFIDRFLVLETKRRLATTDISIKELTYEMGFDEPTNFVKFFKKHTQHSPSKFRTIHTK